MTDLSRPTSSASQSAPSGRLRIAIAQTEVAFDARVNGPRIRAQMREAAAAGARLIQFTEGAMSGYPSGPGKQALTGWDIDWPALRAELEETAALAADLSLWTIIGAAHRLTPPHRPHNSLYVISDRGEIAGRYDKRLLSYSEVTEWYAPGLRPLVFEVDGFRLACLLCIEIQFPELFVECARAGADLVLLSTFSRDPMFAIQAQGHAACGAFWLGFSVPAQYSDAAPAGLVGPDGRWISQAPGDGQASLVIADLDRMDEALQVALRHARRWRETARTGELHQAAQVEDARSLATHRF
ncbi:carbon-nitrogen hydrolase family protein [Phenylobacterium sp.]|uniref:carbon-nitrogen hydrolase family protein n=1 Tax=Phenylobacterium sp. TaxID=1871053 RepID=UPI00272F9002|nr:carbon-nitrogen hydrolase family protein [Phenylobacterium sp.]MDP1618141.1 carbon-nitrogen hydrolase family protein [Phenylobacterium sp.]MDP1985669.1 carbon-nitrogen hydrolase family protein [Phenylobacterium sp.]